MYRESEQFYLQHRGRHLYYQWLHKARDRRRLMIIVNERFQRKQRILLRTSFRQWRDQTSNEKCERRLTDDALDHYDRTLKRRVLLAWHQEMIQQISLDNENEMKFHQYQQNKSHQYRTEIYNRWKSLTYQRRKDRLLLQRADRLFQMNLLRKVFQQWKEQHDFDRRIHLLERQAMWFDRMRLLGRIYLQWKSTYHHEQQFNEQKHRALLFWALQLQKQVN